MCRSIFFPLLKCRHRHLFPPERRRVYEQAVARLEQIIVRLDTGKAELRETLGLVREGKSLVEYCKAEHDAVSGELEELDLDQLVEQLESAGSEQPG